MYYLTDGSFHSTTPHSPFISVRSVDAAVVGDVGRLPVVRVEEEEDVGVEAGVGHYGHPDKRLEYCAPGLGAPAHERRTVNEGSRSFCSAWSRHPLEGHLHVEGAFK